MVIVLLHDGHTERLGRELMSIDALFQKAHEKHRQKKFEAAAKLYREVLGFQPDHLDANYLLGTVYAETGRGAEAEPYLVKAAELDPV